jgi:hypothetical protein
MEVVMVEVIREGWKGRGRNECGCGFVSEGEVVEAGRGRKRASSRDENGREWIPREIADGGMWCDRVLAVARGVLRPVGPWVSSRRASRLAR